MLQGAASGGGVGVVVNTLSDCGRGEDIATVGLSSVASGDENVAGNNLTVVTQEAYNGGIENGFVAIMCGTASSGGGERSDVIGAADGAEGASSSAPKRKRGRPKGSKNKPRAANGAEPKRKRGRPAGSKASPKRSLTQAMGHAQTDAPTEIQPRPELVARSPQRVESAAASALENENDAGGHMLPGTIVPSTSTPDGEEPRTSSARPPSIPALYVNTLVAFAPEKEGWTKRQKTKDKYVGVGSSYLVGRVCRIVKGALFHVQWLDSQYQNKDERLNLSMIQRGNASYRFLHGNLSRVGWSHLCAADEGDDTHVEGEIDDMEECMEIFDPPMKLPTSLSEVEAIKNMRFEPEAQTVEPGDLYRHMDGTTTTRLLPQFKHLFEHSASAIVFAYIPLSFWQQVVGETNSYARVHGVAIATPFTMDEVMAFLGVLFYMELVDKGEYSNYGGQQVEDAIFGGGSVSLDAVIPLRRFKQLRQAFCFRCIEASSDNRDQAARIRPLLNLLKVTGPKYVEVGRNVALDEARVACRSKYGKPLIVYNPMKPTGKYHFRIYMLCCSTTWISLNFRLHCQSDKTERLVGVTTQAEAQALSDELAVSSSIRQCVLEVARPLYGTGRIVNSDNYYISVQLLDALRLKGLYGRGTVRKSSAHFPRHVILEKKDCARGTSRQGVSAYRNTVAASWYDSSIVTVISNADASTVTTVDRQVRSEKRSFNAPTWVKEYNANMQGVDRLDQVRGRFSLADGHSFKKWFKKLGLALVDVGRSNAYFTRKLALGVTNDRDSHREFIVQLSSELLSGKWREAPSERLMLYTDVNSLDAPVTVAEEMSPSQVPCG